MERDKLIRLLHKQFSNVIPNRQALPTPTQFVSTGILSLDWALGGGFPRGHISHIWGPDGGGKTTMMIPTIAGMQPVINGLTLYLATEPKIDETLFYRLGVNPEKIIFARTRSKQDILDGNVVMNMIRQAVGEVDLIVLDSVAGLTPRAMYEMNSEDTAIGKVANLLSYQLPLIANLTAATQTAVIFLNQQRASFTQYGLAEKPFAGYALRHWICNSCYLRSGGWIKRGDNTVGFKPRLTVNKNDFGEPRREANWDFYWHEGVDLIGQTFDFAKLIGVVSARGGVKLGDVSLNHDGERSMDDAKEFLRENPELIKLVYDAVMQAGNTLDLAEDAGVIDDEAA